MTLDQTPTPTQFLQNCEEVGLFKEIEEEFLQAQEEENKKQVSLTSFLLSYYFISLKINHQFESDVSWKEARIKTQCRPVPRCC